MSGKVIFAFIGIAVIIHMLYFGYFFVKSTKRGSIKGKTVWFVPWLSERPLPLTMILVMLALQITGTIFVIYLVLMVMRSKL